MNSITNEAKKTSRGWSRDDDDSAMDSNQGFILAGATAMRVVAVRPDEVSEFRVASEEFGGGKQQKSKSPVKAVSVDGIEFELPLDKVVVQEIVAARRDEEPINHLHQHFDRHVQVGINRPSLTIFSSMGGRRNSSTTVLEFGGSSDAHAKSHTEPKEFFYRDEDFQPLSSHTKSAHSRMHSAASLSSSSAHGTSASRANQGARGQKNVHQDQDHSTGKRSLPLYHSEPSHSHSESSSSFGISPSFFAKPTVRQSHGGAHIHTASHAHGSSGIATPEMHLDQSFIESKSNRSSASGQHRGHAGQNASAHQTRGEKTQLKGSHSIAQSSLPQSPRGPSNGHHARAVPDNRDLYKIPHHNENDPTDHHDHHRHQCDDENCSDYDNSHERLHSAGQHSHQQNYQHQAPVHSRHSAVRSTHSDGRDYSPELNLGALSVDTPSAGSGRASSSTASKHRHVVDAYNAPVHLIHSAGWHRPQAPERSAHSQQPAQHNEHDHHHEHHKHHEHHEHREHREHREHHEHHEHHAHHENREHHEQHQAYHQQQGAPIHKSQTAVHAQHARRNESPELNLGTLFTDMTPSASSSRSQNGQRSASSHQNLADPFNSPAHLIHPAGQHSAVPSSQKGLGGSNISIDHGWSIASGKKRRTSGGKVATSSASTVGRTSHQGQQNHSGQKLQGHAHAVPDNRDSYKIAHHHHDIDPTDHHDHHRHQCDEENCSDHDDSHEHLPSRAGGQSHGSLQQPHSQSARHKSHAALHVSHSHHSSGLATPEMHLDQLFKESIDSQTSKSRQSGGNTGPKAPSHQQEPFNAHPDLIFSAQTHKSTGAFDSWQVQGKGRVSSMTAHSHRPTAIKNSQGNAWTASQDLYSGNHFAENQSIQNGPQKASKQTSTKSADSHASHHADPFNAKARLSHPVSHQASTTGGEKLHGASSQTYATAKQGGVHSHVHTPTHKDGSQGYGNGVASGHSPATHSHPTRSHQTRPHHIDSYPTHSHLAKDFPALHMEVMFKEQRRGQAQGYGHVDQHLGMDSEQRHLEQHLINKKRGNSRGHHAIAVSAHRSPKIKHYMSSKPWDHHNHHRHQCDYDCCSDHDGSHQQFHPEGYVSPHRQHAAALEHDRHAALLSTHDRHSRDEFSASRSKKSNASKMQSTAGAGAHHIDTFNAPAHMIHPAGQKKHESATPQGFYQPAHKVSNVGNHERRQSALFEDVFDSDHEFSQHYDHVDAPFMNMGSLLNSSTSDNLKGGRNVHSGQHHANIFSAHGTVYSEHSDHESSHHHHANTHAAKAKSQQQHQQQTSPTHKSHAAVHANRVRRDQSPELNLGTLFTDMNSSGSIGKRSQPTSSRQHRVDPSDAPAHSIHSAGASYPTTQPSRYHAPVNQHHSSVHVAHAHVRNESPEMNRGSLFAEKESNGKHSHSRHEQTQHGEAHEPKDRSIGHHGHKPAHNLRLVDEHFDYDIEMRESEDPHAHHHPASGKHQSYDAKGHPYPHDAEYDDDTYDHMPQQQNNGYEWSGQYVPVDQHALNRHRGNSHGHHSAAVPDHRDHYKISHQHHDHDPTDHHDHHRHQCDDEDCSDHDESHAHHGQPDHSLGQGRTPGNGSQYTTNSSFASVDSPQLNVGAFFDETPGSSHLGSFTYAQVAKGTGQHQGRIRAQQSHQRHAPTYPRHAAIRASHHHAASASPELNLGALFVEDQSTGKGGSKDHPSRFTGLVGTYGLDDYGKTSGIGIHKATTLSGHAHTVSAHRESKIQHRHYEQDPADHHDHHRHQCDDEYCSYHDESHVHHGGNPSWSKSSGAPKDDFNGYVFDASKFLHSTSGHSNPGHYHSHSSGSKNSHLTYLSDDYMEKARENTISIGQLPRDNRYSGPVEYLEDDEEGGVPFGAVAAESRSTRYIPVYHAAVPHSRAQHARADHAPVHYGTIHKAYNPSISSTRTHQPAGIALSEMRAAAIAGSRHGHASGPSTPVSSIHINSKSTRVPLSKAPQHEDAHRERSHQILGRPHEEPTHPPMPDMQANHPGGFHTASHPYSSQGSGSSRGNTGPVHSSVSPLRQHVNPYMTAAIVHRETEDHLRHHHASIENHHHQHGVHSHSGHIKKPTNRQMKKEAKREARQSISQEVPRRQSVIDTVRSAFGGRRDPTPELHLDQLFVEPASYSQQGAGLPLTGTAMSGIRSIVGAALHVPSMVAHAIYDDREAQDRNASAHNHSARAGQTLQRGHSKAVTLKRRSADLSLYPEEDPYYPRGGPAEHENPSFRHNHVNIIEIPYHPSRHQGSHDSHPSHGSRHIGLHAASLPMHLPHQDSRSGRSHDDSTDSRYHQLSSRFFHHDPPQQHLGHPEQRYSQHGQQQQQRYDQHEPQQFCSQHGQQQQQRYYQHEPQQLRSQHVQQQHHYHHSHHEQQPQTQQQNHSQHEQQQQQQYQQSQHRVHVTHSSAPSRALMPPQGGKHNQSVAPQPHGSRSFSMAKNHQGLYPEESEYYSRGEVSHHENPVHPINVMNVIELPMGCTSSAQGGSRSLRQQHADPHTFAALYVPHSHHASSSHPIREHSYNHSKAVGLKHPQVKLGLYTEEDGSYPRSDDRRRHENPAHPSHVIDSREVRASELHSHHDLHPTITETATAMVESAAEMAETVAESAAAAIVSGVEGVRAMLGNVHLPHMNDLLPEPQHHAQQHHPEHHAQQHHTQQHQLPSHQARASAPTTHAPIPVHAMQAPAHASHGTARVATPVPQSDIYSPRGESYYGQTGYMHNPIYAPHSSARAMPVPMDHSQHRGDAYYGQHEMNSGSSQIHAVVSHAPVSHAPGSYAPAHDSVSHAPVGYATISHAPISHAPISHAPISHAPISHAPVSHASVSHAPVSYAPVSHATAHAPVSHAPVSHVPVSHASASQVSISHAPISHAPASHFSVASAPRTQSQASAAMNTTAQAATHLVAAASVHAGNPHRDIAGLISEHLQEPHESHSGNTAIKQSTVHSSILNRKSESVSVLPPGSEVSLGTNHMPYIGQQNLPSTTAQVHTAALATAPGHATQQGHIPSSYGQSHQASAAPSIHATAPSSYGSSTTTDSHGQREHIQQHHDAHPTAPSSHGSSAAAIASHGQGEHVSQPPDAHATATSGYGLASTVASHGQGEHAQHHDVTGPATAQPTSSYSTQMHAHQAQHQHHQQPQHQQVQFQQQQQQQQHVAAPMTATSINPGHASQSQSQSQPQSQLQHQQQQAQHQQAQQQQQTYHQQQQHQPAIHQSYTQEPSSGTAASGYSTLTATATTTLPGSQIGNAPVQIAATAPIHGSAQTLGNMSTSTSHQTTSSQAQFPSNTTTTTVIEAPAGYSGPLPQVHEGETVIWVKKTLTTQEFYDSDNTAADLDEFGIPHQQYQQRGGPAR